MDAHVNNVPENCNGCVYKEMVSRHWELEDYCALNKINISRMVMEEDCPLAERGRDYVQSTTLR